jgi:hypothetical protein
MRICNCSESASALGEALKNTPVTDSTVLVAAQTPPGLRARVSAAKPAGMAAITPLRATLDPFYARPRSIEQYQERLFALANHCGSSSDLHFFIDRFLRTPCFARDPPY